MNDYRIARVDIFFCGGFVAAVLGSVLQVGFSDLSQLVWLGIVLLVTPMLGTLAALWIAGRPITPAPFLWGLVGAVGATFVGLASFFVVYDLLLIVFAPVAMFAFLVALAVVVWHDRRVWTRVLRLALVAVTAAILIVPWALSQSQVMQPVGAWILAILPVAGAALLAPVPWRFEPILRVLPDTAEDQLSLS